MINERDATLKAKRYLLAIGFTGLQDLFAEEHNGELYCYPIGLKPFIKYSEIDYDAVITLKMSK